MEFFLTVGQVAARLGLSADGVRYLSRVGQLAPAMRVGRNVRLFSADEVERFAAKREKR